MAQTRNDRRPWPRSTRPTGLNLTATTDSAGTLWMFVGADSGFERPSALDYDTIVVQLEWIGG